MRADHEPAKPAPDISELLLPPELRRAINDELPPGYVCAVHRPPAKADGAQPAARVIAVRLPRGSAKRPPRRGVYIPLPPVASVGLERAGKHARGHHDHGCFGRKKGALTIAAKLRLLFEGWRFTLEAAVERMRRRALLGRATA